MASRRQFMNGLLTLPAALLLSSCQSAKPVVQSAAAARYTSTGATVVDANEKTAKLHIRCPRCGYTTELEIPVPTADKPYAQEWKCPRCGRRQQITVEVAKAK